MITKDTKPFSKKVIPRGYRQNKRKAGFFAGKSCRYIIDLGGRLCWVGIQVVKWSFSILAFAAILSFSLSLSLSLSVFTLLVLYRNQFMFFSFSKCSYPSLSQKENP
jgi:hypothetical protein